MRPSKTDQRQRRHARIRAKVTGTAECPRLCVYRSNTSTYAQMIDDARGVTLFTVSDLGSKVKDSKLIRAKSIGLDIAKAAIEKGIKACVFDRNGYKYHGRVKAIAEGAREGGLQF